MDSSHGIFALPGEAKSFHLGLDSGSGTAVLKLVYFPEKQPEVV